MHAGWRDLEVPLHVGFRGRLAEDTAVGVDEGQVLTLFVGVRIPIQSGQGFRFDVGRRSDLMSATIPK